MGHSAVRCGGIKGVGDAGSDAGQLAHACQTFIGILDGAKTGLCVFAVWLGGRRQLVRVALHGSALEGCLDVRLAGAWGEAQHPPWVVRHLEGHMAVHRPSVYYLQCTAMLLGV